MEENSELRDDLPEPRSVKSVWFKDQTTEDDRQARLAQLYNNSSLFNDIREILQSLYNESKRRTRGAEGSANWAMTICAEQKYREALEDVAKILPNTDH